MRKPEPPPAAEDTLKGKRVRLSSKHPAYYYYNKSARGKWNRASQVIEGMRWNAYKSSGKETPLPCPLHVPEFAPMMGGRMREAMGEERAGLAQAPRKKEREASCIPQAATDARAPETQAHQDYHNHHEKAAGMAHDEASVQRFQEAASNPRLEHDLALHEGIQAGGRVWQNEGAEGDGHRHEPAHKVLAPVEPDDRLNRHILQLQIAGQTAGGHIPYVPSSHAQAEGPHESRPAPDQQPLTASLPPMPSGSAPVAHAIHHAPHSIRAREGHAGAAAQATRPETVHPADTPGAPAIAVHDVRIARGPGWISSAAKKVVQLKVTRADAQPPGDI